MAIVHRVLFPEPITSLAEYQTRRGGAGLEAARAADPEMLIAELEASGLRGRGGAGFPTGTKWRTVRQFRSPDVPTTVVVNGAEGEPGTFKDRTILRVNPYPVIEGALIAAKAVGADQVVFGLKRTFRTEVARLQSAVDEVKAAGWADGITLTVFEGPEEYLYGEETALLETIDGRYPFPRIAPPWRRGETEVVEHDADAESGSGLSAHVEMADASGETGAPPALVDNLETMANVPRIIARGAAWFRTEGTDDSPGTMVCTVIGDVQQAGVAEFEMGTPLREVIDEISGGARPGRTIKAVLPGVANAVITADQLEVPISYEAMAAIGSGLGSGGFIVFDDSADLVAVAAGVSRFLAVESCGQCTPCKQDGIVLSDLLARVGRSDASERDLASIKSRVDTVANSARCYLATQHQAVVGSILERFPAEFEAHISASATPVEPQMIAELVDIKDGEAILDERHREKQFDWSYDAEDSGQAPADRFDDHRHQQPLPE
jgi:NADH:ubiquinone oxidoreductase subunit F (NADH-binding)